jgi:hypothetical protein
MNKKCHSIALRAAISVCAFLVTSLVILFTWPKHDEFGFPIVHSFGWFWAIFFIPSYLLIAGASLPFPMLDGFLKQHEILRMPLAIILTISEITVIAAFVYFILRSLFSIFKSE